MGRYDYLYVKPFTRATSSWANSLVDALNELYDLSSVALSNEQIEEFLQNLPVSIVPTSPVDLGSVSSPFGTVYAFNGSFLNDLYVQGKRVIKDDDPIHIYDFFPTAEEQLCESVECGIKNTIKLDPYGNVGVIISGPLDPYGAIVTTTERLFRPVYKRFEVTASSNTSGLEGELDTEGRPNVTVAWYVSSPATVYIEGSNDGVYWYPIYSASPSGSGSYTFTTAFRLIRARIPTTGIDARIEISASR